MRGVMQLVIINLIKYLGVLHIQPVGHQGEVEALYTTKMLFFLIFPSRFVRIVRLFN